jgi:zinc/manganese transport system substrate-binding protein
MRRLLLAAVAALGFAGAPAAAAVNVFACEPEWASLAQEIGGPDVSVFAATAALQDPHQVQARPSLIARLRSADFVICTGAELEIGWMPNVLRQGNNGRVQPGTPGYMEAVSFVPLLEVPSRLDRAEGDVHAAGNPHIQTGPQNIPPVAAALARRLSEIDPAHAAGYTERGQRFLARWDEAMLRWRQQVAPLNGVNVATYHKNWIYLTEFCRMHGVVDIEPKPGVPPSASHLAQVITEVPLRQVKMILYAAYQDPRASEFVAERTGVSAVMLPHSPGGTPAAKDLFSMFDDTFARMLAALQGRVGKS